MSEEKNAMSEEMQRQDYWESILFCPELQGCSVNCDKVADLLADNLFRGNPEARKLFVARYRQMQENYSGVSHNDKKWDLKFGTETFRRAGTGKDALLSVPQCALSDIPKQVAELWKHRNFGHDMPTWMVKSGVKNPRRVMIMSQDPLRTGHSAGQLLLSTPFGFHSKDYRAKCKNDDVYNLVWRLLERGDCVYLTDCLKFYTKDDEKKNFVTSNLKRKFWEMFKLTFEAEIRAFDPDVILGLGGVFFENVFGGEKGKFTKRAGSCPCVGTVTVKDGGTDRDIRALSFLHPSARENYKKRIYDSRPNMTRKEALLDYYTNWQ